MLPTLPLFLLCPRISPLLFFLSQLLLHPCIVPFQGSVFVEFCEKEDFEKFLRLDVVMFRDKELLRESK